MAHRTQETALLTINVQCFIIKDTCMVRPLKLAVLLPSVNSLPNMCLLQLFIGLKGVMRASVGFLGNG